MSFIFLTIDQELKAGRPVVLARIIHHSGSVPRSTGAAMLILSDGSILETIGGGTLEHAVVAKADEIFRHRRTALMHFDLTANDSDDAGMLCGGRTTIMLEPMTPDEPQTKTLVAAIARTLRSGKGGILYTRVTDQVACESCERLFVADTGIKTGDLRLNRFVDTIDGDQPGLHELNIAEPVLVTTADGRADLFVEPIRPADTVVIFGAGHIATALAPLAKQVGFRVIVIDDRADFANPQRFPDAADVRRLPFVRAFQDIDINRASYLVIVTHGHRCDREVLHLALEKPCAYIGMVGSRRKRDAIYAWLLLHNVVRERLEAVHCPIGLDIGAQTPAEIAVSIVAELIQVRRGGRRPSKESP